MLGEVQGRQDAETECVFPLFQRVIPAGLGDEDQRLKVGDTTAVIADDEGVAVGDDLDVAGLRAASILQQLTEHGVRGERVPKVGDQAVLVGLETDGAHGMTPD